MGTKLKSKLVVVFFGTIVVIAVMFLEQLLSSGIHKNPIADNNSISESKEQSNENASDSKTSRNLNSKNGTCKLKPVKQPPKNSENLNKEIALLENLEVAQDFDDYIQRANDYLSIDEHTIGQMLSKIQIKNEQFVTKEQIAKLREELSESILAYKQGDAKTIVLNMLKAPYQIKPEATNWHSNLLRNQYLKTPQEQLPADSTEIMIKLVSKNYGGSNGSGYKDIYNELSPEGSSIEFYETANMPESIHEKLFRLMDFKVYKFQNGYVTLTPSIEYSNTPAKILKENNSLLYADVRIAASDAEGSKYSRLKRYYWSKDDSQWLPMECVILPPSGSKFEFF